ncbi:MAG: polyhydroxyalkanoic acid synthase [Hyphomicrobiales bacterium]|nr:polyhydroxyalkanoic acid synthase [Hyphomicrobiales bacterium]
MAREMNISIPHQLGAEEATRRLREGLERMRVDYGSRLAAADIAWTASHADLRVGALGQLIDGTLDVTDDQVNVAVRLPWVLAAMSDKVAAFLKRTGSDTLRLEPPKNG